MGSHNHPQVDRTPETHHSEGRSQGVVSSKTKEARHEKAECRRDIGIEVEIGKEIQGEGGIELEIRKSVEGIGHRIIPEPRRDGGSTWKNVEGTTHHSVISYLKHKIFNPPNQEIALSLLTASHKSKPNVPKPNLTRQ